MGAHLFGVLLQAKLTESEGKVGDLETEVHKLRLEKSVLESRNAILEKVLQLRGPIDPPALRDANSQVGGKEIVLVTGSQYG